MNAYVTVKLFRYGFIPS